MFRKLQALAAMLLTGSVLLAALPSHGWAQEEPERCPRLIAWQGARAVPAGFPVLAQSESEVAITFVGHASFLIESPAGVRVVTDYNDHIRPQETPHIATMNIAHSTHHARAPDPGILHLLAGWGENGNPARHELELEDVWVRNVTTNIRGGMGGTERDRNSIFIFEVAGLCIAHLGHLHHTLTDAHLDALGRIDVVLAPVDGSYTLDSEGMAEVLRSIQAPLVIPMHFFGQSTLERFLSRMSEDYEIQWNETGSTTLSRAMLPVRPTILVLPGRHF